MLQEEREQYSLWPNFLVFEKTEDYVVQTGLVTWLTMYLESVHYFHTKSREHFSFISVSLYEKLGISEFSHFALHFLKYFYMKRDIHLKIKL